MNIRKIIVFVAALLVPVAAGADWSNVDVNKLKGLFSKAKKAAKGMTPEEEIQLGRDAAAKILGGAPLVNDPALQAYVNRIGRWLALHTDRPDLPWRFGVLADDDVNAFAMPGGIILITRGMVMRCRDEAELAGILAHEMVHVLDRHTAEAIRKGARNELAADLASVYAQKNAENKAELVTKIGNTTAEVFTRGLDKKEEYAADRKGVVIAARAGYDPYGLAGVLQTLASINPESGAVALMFKTHPDSNERLKLLTDAMEGRLEQFANQARLPERFQGVMQAHLSHMSSHR